MLRQTFHRHARGQGGSKMNSREPEGAQEADGAEAQVDAPHHDGGVGEVQHDGQRPAQQVQRVEQEAQRVQEDVERHAAATHKRAPPAGPGSQN